MKIQKEKLRKQFIIASRRAEFLFLPQGGRKVLKEKTYTLKTVLKNNSKNGYPFLAPDLRGNTFRFLLLIIIYPVGLLYMAFIML